MGDLRSEDSNNSNATGFDMTAITTLASEAMSKLALRLKPASEPPEPSFSGLPDELVDQIFSYLEGPNEGSQSFSTQPSFAPQKDFWTLCLVNRQCLRA